MHLPTILTTLALLLTPTLALSSPLKLSNDPSFPQFPLSGQPSIAIMPSLADRLTVERSFSLFYEYAREVQACMDLVSNSLTETTLLVPVDKAIIALPRKPHQDPLPPTNPPIISPSRADLDSSATTNVARFVSAHVIPQSIPSEEEEGGKGYKTLLKGFEVSFRRDGEGRLRVDPGDVEVLKVVEASNGKIYYLDGALKY